MYKVFVNDKPLILSDEKPSLEKDALLFRFRTDAQLRSAIDELESGEKKRCVTVLHDDPEELWLIFRRFFLWKEAAGGLVTNRKGERLFIFRRGKWDLPKGGILPGEEAPAAALREVQEECGPRKLTLLRPLPPTYHTYRRDNRKFLKMTHWFALNAPGDEPLVPCLTEDITVVKWIGKGQLQSAMKSAYLSIREVIAEAGE